ncbi:sulfotransferase domain-containing protein [Phytohabitans houttuyneae]|uniref:Glycolipid sulfotransferase n=1 Tax=Phytohabitans houttuyneae TaxID=1076126 RepID=A0A6V8K0Y1_9ACTN|nr:sulfotransferase domain-containing protein [Phytohabitans houttuyneae]GFJ77240.1 glycolipid sulfotransferase [Phytohabitans houttuyneae]
MASTPIRFQPPGEDGGRWLGFRFRAGDIVISTPPKSGTTWMQMICALLIFQSPDLPEPLWRLSPWLDSPGAPREHVYAHLAAQRHRRFIKTHAPLREIPSHPEVTYIVTARHPLDAFVSLYHQDQMIGPPPGPPPPGQPEAPGPPWLLPPPGPPPTPRGPEAVSPERLHEALVAWIAGEDRPRAPAGALPDVMRHLTEAWSRRDEPNVVLVHYDDLLTDLEGQMRRLDARLGTAVAERSWPALAGAATFARMRERKDILVPPPPGIVPEPSRFFRRGTSGAAREILSAGELAAYHARAARLAPPGMREWLHREDTTKQRL